MQNEMVKGYKSCFLQRDGYDLNIISDMIMNKFVNRSTVIIQMNSSITEYGEHNGKDRPFQNGVARCQPTEFNA